MPNHHTHTLHRGEEIQQNVTLGILGSWQIHTRDFYNQGGKVINIMF